MSRTSPAMLLLFCCLCAAIRAVPVAHAQSQSLAFGSVHLLWSDSIAPSAMHNVESVSASVFTGDASETEFTAAIGRILVALESDGYREARVSPGDFNADGSALSFTLRVTPGPRSRVVGYSFANLTHTDTLWLKKLVAQPVDVPLTANWLRTTAARLARLSSVRIAAEPGIITVGDNPEANETSVIVRWPLEEDRNARLGGLLAVGGEGDQSGLTGRASMQFDGLFGRDRSIAVRYYRPRPQWNSLNLRFAERGAFGGPLDWALELDESHQWDRRQRVATRVDLSLGHSATWTLGASASWHRVTPGDAIAAPARILDASLGIEKPMRPAARARLTTMSGGLWTTFSHRQLFSGDANNAAAERLRLDAHAGIVHPINDRWELSLTSMGRAWVSGRETLGFGDEWYLGGPDQMRGYDDQTFAAASGLWGVAEIGYWLAPSLGLSLFGEAAHFSEITPQGDAPRDRQPAGYGTALRLMSGGRVGRLEFAWRRDAALRDGFVRLNVTQSW